MTSSLRALLFVALAGITVGCSPINTCDEFATPQDRQPSNCPKKPPPASKTDLPKRYCYSTLAQPDCFAQPQPGRDGYLGDYQP